MFEIVVVGRAVRLVMIFLAMPTDSLSQSDWSASSVAETRQSEVAISLDNAGHRRTDLDRAIPAGFDCQPNETEVAHCQCERQDDEMRS